MHSKPPAGLERLWRRQLAGFVALLAAALGALAQDLGPHADAAAAVALYQYRLLQVGSRLRGYPPEALKSRLQGTATVALHLSAAGSLTRQVLVESSGSPLLDEHALALLAQAVPLTEIPATLQNRPFIVRVAVAFKLPADH